MLRFQVEYKAVLLGTLWGGESTEKFTSLRKENTEMAVYIFLLTDYFILRACLEKKEKKEIQCSFQVALKVFE